MRNGTRTIIGLAFATLGLFTGCAQRELTILSQLSCGGNGTSPYVFLIRICPTPRLVAMRPHVADAEAYTTEQEAWRTWNDMHLSAEAQVNPYRLNASIG